MTKRIGWIGTGVMGRSMCGHLLRAGHQVTVYNRSKAKLSHLLEQGAAEAESPAMVARQSELIFTMVGFPQDVSEVLCGEQGVLSGSTPGSIIIDMTTSSPSLARAIYTQAKCQSVQSLDAPVSGGDIGAKEAKLSIMVGGDVDTFEAVLPVLSLLGKTIIHQGQAGSGQSAKLANQIAIASGMIGVCEALLFGYKAGLDLRSLLESISGGAAGSWSLSNYGPRVIEGNFDPGFFVDHFVKDMAIALEESRQMRLALPGLALAEQLYRSLQASGNGQNGTHSLMIALSRLSSVDWQEAVKRDNGGLPRR